MTCTFSTIKGKIKVLIFNHSLKEVNMKKIKMTVKEFITDLSFRLADDSDYEEYWLPQLSKLHEMACIDEAIKDNVDKKENYWNHGGKYDN